MQYTSIYHVLCNLGFFAYALYARSWLDLNKYESAILLIITVIDLLVHSILFLGCRNNVRTIKTVLFLKLSYFDFGLLLTTLIMDYSILKIYYLLYIYGIACMAFGNTLNLIEHQVEEQNHIDYII